MFHSVLPHSSCPLVHLYPLYLHYHIGTFPSTDHSTLTISTTSSLSSCPSSPCVDFPVHTLPFLLSILHNFLVPQSMHHKLVTKILDRSIQKPFLKPYHSAGCCWGNQNFESTGSATNPKFLFSNGYSVLLPILSH